MGNGLRHFDTFEVAVSTGQRQIPLPPRLNSLVATVLRRSKATRTYPNKKVFSFAPALGFAKRNAGAIHVRHQSWYYYRYRIQRRRR